MLPVIISGAGPCGLMCAVVLQKHNVPFTIIERVEQSRLTSDVGSGFDMAPTALRIFEYLELPQWKERMSSFGGITMMKMTNGQHVRIINTDELPGKEAFAAKRSALQQCLVEKLGDNKDACASSSKEEKDGGGWISGTNAQFGVSVVGYEEEQDKVMVRLSNGTELEGRALLSCEGWRSATRAQMLGGAGKTEDADNDPVNFCGIAMWWGKCEVTPKILELLRPTQTLADDGGGESFCWFMGDGREPGNFVAALADGGQSIMWSAAQSCPNDPAQSDDLTIRGGVRGAIVKEEYETIIQGRCELIREIVSATEAKSVTKVGLYDRQNLNQNMVSTTTLGGRVALLGDAGHPQTPFLGQGCNMALADAFAVCTRLGAAAAGGGSDSDGHDDSDGQIVRSALSCLDDPLRKQFVKTTVTEARKIAKLSTSSSTFGNFCTRLFMKVAPTRYIFPRVDEGNRIFVNQALTDCGLAPLPE